MSEFPCRNIAEIVKIGIMDFKIHTPPNKSPKPARRPPNYGSRAVRLRLGTLVVMLGITAIAMNEASKPETWHWLGFNASVNQDAAAEPDTSEPPVSGTVVDEGNVIKGFYTRQFNGMKPDQRKLLAQIAEHRADGRAFTGNAEIAKNLISDMVANFKRFEAESNEITDQESESLRQLFQDLTRYIAGANAPADLQSAIHLKQTIDRLAYDLVEDRSSLRRSAESLAWQITWRRLNPGEPATGSKLTNIVQLVGQPTAYRGQRVSIAGTARGLEKLKVADQELDFAHYHVLWIKPQEMSRTPFCVYLRRLPKDFPTSDDRFQNLDEPVTVEGIFFKLRSYVSTSEEIETCPLILADTCSWRPRPTVESTAAWQPPAWLITLTLIGLPLLAAWMAMAVFRSTKVIPIETSESEREQIATNLELMSSDDSIQSDRQRIFELQQQGEDDQGQNHE